MKNSFLLLLVSIFMMLLALVAAFGIGSDITIFLLAVVVLFVWLSYQEINSEYPPVGFEDEEVPLSKEQKYLLEQEKKGRSPYFLKQ